MGVIEKVREEREDLARVLKNHKGIRKIVEELYPDPAHFLYELLQNAEDAGATDAMFSLSDGSVVFEHNGRPFDEQDIFGITDIGEGTKAGDGDKIGQFGIGFNAVFAYSETPHIWSPTYCFKITDLVLPTSLDSIPELNGRTRFGFPFNSPKKSSDEAYREVSSGLSHFAPMTLLFLSHLKSISWRVEGTSAELRRVQHSENHVEVVKQIGGRKTGSHFLLFEQPVEGLERKRAAIAFELRYLPKTRQFDSHKPLAEQLKIVPATPGRVAVYFPAEKETSGLRFHLHAPFVPELSRASIKETRAKEPLFEQLAVLTASALHQIRDMGVLTRDFLAVLPSRHDSVPERYQCIRAAVIAGMRTQPLTPTHSKSHAPADHLRQAKDSIKNLLSDDDLEFLLNEEPRHWAIAPTQKNSDVDRFLDGLQIERWDIEQFVSLLEEQASQWSPDEDFVEWLGRKPADWHQRLYALLHDELSPQDELSRLATAQIVRLSDGNYSVGEKCFFPSDGVVHDKAHPRVDAAVFTSGKSKKEQEKVRRFLEAIGVREVGEVEEIQLILDQRYSEEVEIPDEKTYRKDLRRFIKLVEEAPDAATLFERYWILESKSGWRQSSELFLDQPFADTGLRAFYDLLPEEHEARRWPLSKHYEKCGIAIKRLVQFATAIGAQDQLTVEKQWTCQHPEAKELQQDYRSSNTQERYDTKTDEDWTVSGLEKALSHPSKQLAKLLWQTLIALEPEKLRARYRPNRGFRVREALSSLILLLRNHAWIPQGKSGFVRPADASRKRLPKDFEYDPEWPWLQAIGFGENDAKESERQRELKDAAKKLGLDFDAARRLAGFPREEQQQLLADFEQRRSREQEQSNSNQPDASEAGTQAPSARAKGRRAKGSSTDEGEPTTTSRPVHARNTSSNRTQFVSYVAVEPDDAERDPDGLNHETRIGLEEKAIRLILAREPELRRTPINNPGFDLYEENSSGETARWVEVKAMTGSLHDRPVGMSHTQFDCAREHREAYWLYVVEYAGDDKARIVRIQDPATKAKTFTFDHGWLGVAELDDMKG